MENMRFKVGDRVRIKSLDWYNESKNNKGIIVCGSESFTHPMSHFCDKVVTIVTIQDDCYRILEDDGDWYWTDEMIECKVEEENKPKFKVGDEVRIKGTDIGGTVESVIRGQLIVNSKGSKIPAWPEDVVLMKSMEEETKPNIIEEAKTYWDSIKDAWICPDGYIFKDENGNVINATKIVLEKKKKEYPNNFYHCVRTLGLHSQPADASKYKTELIRKLQTLLVCRDAYWKIAGEEMGLGKPWEPDWNGKLYYLYYNPTNTTGVVRGFTSDGVLAYVVLAFPTAEMRDAFYENFKELIEVCKELL